MSPYYETPCLVLAVFGLVFSMIAAVVITVC